MQNLLGYLKFSETVFFETPNRFDLRKDELGAVF
jgi:hypothetical protein